MFRVFNGGYNSNTILNQVYTIIVICTKRIYRGHSGRVVPGMASSGKAGSCLPLVGSLQNPKELYVLVSSAPSNYPS